MFRQDVSCPALLKDMSNLYAYGAVTLLATLPNVFGFSSNMPLAWSAFARRY
jgi:hypothetical protein